MKKIILTTLVAFTLGLPHRMHAESFATAVIDYNPGTPTFYNDPNAVLGKPGDIVGVGSGFEGVFSPFNPHYESSELTGIGFGGQLTLQLQNFVTVTTGAREIGIWSNVGLTDVDYPNGTADNPTSTFSSPSSAVVSVSANGVDWVTLNGGAPITFSLPGLYYSNAGPFDSTAPESPVLADFGKPFTGTLSDFDGKTYPQIVETLNGSAGGTWLDLDSTGLSEVGYIRFNGVASGEELYLNAVSINSTLSGGAVPEPASGVLLLIGVSGMLFLSRRRCA